MIRKILLLLLVLAFIGQLTVLGRSILLSQQTLNHGKEYRFLTTPIDPYDAFRGRYVRLGFAVSNEPYTTDKETCDEIIATSQVIVQLSEDEHGFAQISALSTQYPEQGDSFMTQAYCRQTTGAHNRHTSKDSNHQADGHYSVRISLPFTKFYANEYQAPKLERQARENADATYLSVRVLNHRAIPQTLHINENNE